MSRVAGAITLVVASVIVYHSALGASFFDDDFQWLVQSWSFDPSRLVAFRSMSHFYRPMVDLYFAAMTPLLGGSPVLFHAAGIGVHIATVLVVFALASRLTGDWIAGFITALFFAVQPSDIDAVAWVSAISESASTLFGCLALLWFVRWLDGAARARWLSAGAYTLALLTHESSVMFLPVMCLAEWFGIVGQTAKPGNRWSKYWPYAAITAAYLAIDVYINSRNYVVSEGHYAIGFHMLRNALGYVDALYVGRHDVTSDVAISIGIMLLLGFGNARVRFATLWMLLAMAPFLGFTWGNQPRYLYQPAIPFSMLLAEGARVLGRGARAVSGRRIEASVASLVVAAMVALRFAVFALPNVNDFAVRSRVYATYLAAFRQAHPTLASHSTVEIDPGAIGRPHQFVEAAVQWAYGDSTIHVAEY